MAGTFVRPSIVLCDAFARTRWQIRIPLVLTPAWFKCPVGDAPADRLHPACSVITKDAKFIEQVMAYPPHIERLNIGPVSTMKISGSTARRQHVRVPLAALQH